MGQCPDIDRPSLLLQRTLFLQLPAITDEAVRAELILKVRYRVRRVHFLAIPRVAC